jgi:UDP-N-acetyl-D-mannosaminuronic acid dehydrogenase
MKICVVGLGYIGLPSAALLASRGHNICGVDTNRKVVDTINSGRVHIVEPDLDSFVRAAVDSGRLKASTNAAEAEIFIIAVPTPFKDDHDPDLKYVISASRSIAPYLRPGNFVILESTSPVGTTESMENILKDEGVDTADLFIAYCPERVLPGRMMIELIENSRIVGGRTPEAAKKVAEFYRTFVTGRVFETDAMTAEMCKLAENASRDVQIAFANELSMICDKLNVDVWEVIELANRHPRVNILKPGAGVGGHCIAVDPWFIVHSAPGESVMIREARHRNLRKTEWVVEKIMSEVLALERKLKRKPVVACMGLAFKPDIDDLRESPAVYVARKLIEAGIELLTVEPNIDESGEFNLCSIEDVKKKADLFALLVAHSEFKAFPLEEGRYLDFCGITKK